MEVAPAVPLRQARVAAAVAPVAVALVVARQARLVVAAARVVLLALPRLAQRALLVQRVRLAPPVRRVPRALATAAPD